MVNTEVTNFDIIKKYFETNNRYKDVTAHLAKVHSVDWNADGRRLASGSFDKTVSLYSFHNDKLSKEYTFKGLLLVHFEFGLFIFF